MPRAWIRACDGPLRGCGTGRQQRWQQTADKRVSGVFADGAQIRAGARGCGRRIGVCRSRLAPPRDPHQVHALCVLAQFEHARARAGRRAHPHHAHP